MSQNKKIIYNYRRYNWCYTCWFEVKAIKIPIFGYGFKFKLKILNNDHNNKIIQQYKNKENLPEIDTIIELYEDIMQWKLWKKKYISFN
tara:strand:- start:1440 stop:1706 length:267 start_codon:yes stop_codon:yes gene_type:complete